MGRGILLWLLGVPLPIRLRTPTSQKPSLLDEHAAYGRVRVSDPDPLHRREEGLAHPALIFGGRDPRPPRTHSHPRGDRALQ